jgi:hypothetical protein
MLRESEKTKVRGGHDRACLWAARAEGDWLRDRVARRSTIGLSRLASLARSPRSSKHPVKFGAGKGALEALFCALRPIGEDCQPARTGLNSRRPYPRHMANRRRTGTHIPRLSGIMAIIPPSCSVAKDRSTMLRSQSSSPKRRHDDSAAA